MTMWKYIGRDKTGTGRVGAFCADSVAEFVKSRYRRGWRTLKVTPLDDSDTEAGAISRHPDTGRRVWWAEGGGAR